MLKIQEKYRKLLAGMMTGTTSTKKKNISPDINRPLVETVHVYELWLWKASLVSQKNKLHELFDMEVERTEQSRSLPTIDNYFLQKLQRVMEAHLSDPDFNVETLSQEMGLSRVHLYRKLKALTDESPSNLLRNFRLQKAAVLLAQGTGSVSDIAYRSGFNDLSHFSKSFKKVFGLCPSQHKSFKMMRYNDGGSPNGWAMYQHMLPTD